MSARMGGGGGGTSVSPSSATPLPIAASGATAGSSTLYAREGHVHGGLVTYAQVWNGSAYVPTPITLFVGPNDPGAVADLTNVWINST